MNIIDTCKAHILQVDGYAINDELVEGMQEFFRQLTRLFPESKNRQTDPIYIFDYFKRLHAKLFINLSKKNPAKPKEALYYQLFSLGALLAMEYLSPHEGNEKYSNEDYVKIINDAYAGSHLEAANLHLLKTAYWAKVLRHKPYSRLDDNKINLILNSMSMFAILAPLCKLKSPDCILNAIKPVQALKTYDSHRENSKKLYQLMRGLHKSSDNHLSLQIIEENSEPSDDSDNFELEPANKGVFNAYHCDSSNRILPSFYFRPISEGFLPDTQTNTSPNTSIKHVPSANLSDQSSPPCPASVLEYSFDGARITPPLPR